MFVVTYPSYIREKARQMRIERDMTLDEIAERLAIGKTTVWYWIKDIDDVPMGASRKSAARTVARERATRANVARAAALRDAAYQRGLDEYPALIERPGFRDFICMYIGEGYKRNRNRVSIANSDPRVMELANFWMVELADRKLEYSVQYHADQDPDELQTFWSSLFGVETDEIKLQRKSNSNQLAGRTWRSVWGVASAGASDTYLRSRLQAWIDQVHGSWLDSFH